MKNKIDERHSTAMNLVFKFISFSFILLYFWSLFSGNGLFHKISFNEKSLKSYKSPENLNKIEAEMSKILRFQKASKRKRNIEKKS